MTSALELLREMRSQKPVETLPVTTPETARRVLLEEFAASRRVLRVWSDVLGEEVIFAGDKANVAAIPGLVIYRGRELTALWGEDGRISPEYLRRIHEAKKVFGGEVTGDGEARRQEDAGTDETQEVLIVPEQV